MRSIEGGFELQWAKKPSPTFLWPDFFLQAMTMPPWLDLEKWNCTTTITSHNHRTGSAIRSQSEKKSAQSSSNLGNFPGCCYGPWSGDQTWKSTNDQPNEQRRNLSHYFSILHSTTVYENHPKCRIWIFQFWHFPPIFDLLILTCLVTLFDRKL